MINHPFILRIRKLFPYADKLLLHFPAGVMAGSLTLSYSTEPYEIIRNSTDLGLLKEAWDYGRSNKINRENLLDLMATMAGGVFVAVVVWIVR